jgi:hypothetical protein
VKPTLDFERGITARKGCVSAQLAVLVGIVLVCSARAYSLDSILLNRAATSSARVDAVSDLAPSRQFTLPPGPSRPSRNISARRPVKMLNSRPLTFIENKGQFDSQVSFSAPSSNHTVWLTNDALTFDLMSRETSGEALNDGAGRGPLSRVSAVKIRRTRVSERMVGAGKAVFQPAVEEPGEFNYFLGRDRSKWRTGVHGYRMVTWREVWKNINLRLYGMGSALEQEFVLMPGGRPDSIRIAIDGARAVKIGHDGSLLIETDGGQLRESPPVAYQHRGSRKIEVAANFRIYGDGQVGFEIAPYDRSRPLVIDPALLYSTYLGGVHDDSAESLYVDENGNGYITGYTASANFPISANAYQTQRSNIGYYTFDTFVTKIAPTGTLIYSTFVGGSQNDLANNITVDSLGSAYIVGQSNSSDYPTTPGAYQTTFNNYIDGFITKLSPDGSSLVYSSYFGGLNVNVGGYGNIGNNFVLGIALDSAGDAFLTGATGSPDFPTTPGAFQTTYPLTNPGVEDMAGFVSELDPTGSKLVFSTFLSGSTSFNYIAGIALDASGSIVVDGASNSSSFPTTPGAYQTSPKGGFDAIIAKLKPNGSSLVCSTLLGGSGNDATSRLIIGTDGNFYVDGGTNSTNFPTTPGVFASTNSKGLNELFVARLSSDCSSLGFGSYVEQYEPNPGIFGNFFDLGAIALAIDPAGNLFVASDTPDQNMATTTDAVQRAFGGGNYDGFLIELTPDATAEKYATYFGGPGDDGINTVAVDGSGNVYFAGATTSSSDFPLTANALQTVFGGTTDQVPDGHDAFFASLGTGVVSSVVPASGGNAGSVTISISGSGFQPSATASLINGATTIMSSKAYVVPGGQTINALFELAGVAPGSYTVVVNNPDGTSVTSLSKFTVVSGGATQLWSNIVGRSTIRSGTPTTFYVTYGNSGNVDAYFTTLWLTFPAGFTFTPQFELKPPPQLPGQLAPNDWSVFPSIVQNGSDELLGIMVPALPAGAVKTLSFQITAPTTGSFQLTTAIYPELTHDYTDLLNGAKALRNAPAIVLGANAGNNISNAAHCFGDVMGAIMGAIPGAGCVGAITTAALSHFIGGLGDFAAGFSTGQSTSWQTPMTQFATDMAINAGLPCLSSALLAAPGGQGLGVALAIMNAAINLCQAMKDCGPFFPGLPPCLKDLGPCAPGAAYNPDAVMIDRIVFPEAGGGGQCSNNQSASSIDPNDKGAPAGVGPQNYVPANLPLAYVVQYENEPSTATQTVLPAQKVVVTDPLNPSLVDLSTLSLGLIQFGTHVINPPAGLTSYSTTVDLRPAQDLLVEVQGSLNTATGQLTWTFSSIDPATGLPPADPTVGFLPPDNNPPEGEGSVVFNVNPISNLANGTPIANTAKVVFDQNAPILTPTRTVTIAGTAKQPLRVSPRSLAFGRQPVFGNDGGSSRTRQIVLANPKGAKNLPILITKITPPPGFVVTNPGQCNTLLNPGQKCIVSVYFAPYQSGKISGVVTIADNAANGPTQTVAVSGVGTPGTLSLQPRTIAFGRQPVNQTSNPRTLKIVNTSGAQALVTAITAPANFTTSNDQCSGLPLAPKKSCTVSISFTPTAKGPVRGKLEVATDSTSSPQYVGLSGMGVVPKK